MYEDNSKKFVIDWKSLIIKIIILLIVLCLIIWIISLFKKDKKVSNISDNLTIMKEAAEDYFVASKLPTNVNDKVKMTLDKMVEEKLIIELKDQNGKTCNNKESYAEVTKIDEDNYSLKVKLVCSSDNDYIIDTINIPHQDNNNDEITKPEENNNDQKEPTANNNSNNNQTNNNVAQNTKPNNNSNQNTKPSTNSNQKPSTNSNQNTKPNTNNSTPNVNPTPSCTYGTKEYVSFYPLAYIIEGNCAVSFNDYYNAPYANKVSDIGATEYKKLSDEITALASETGTSLYVEAPIYSGVYNKAGTGLVGYQIRMSVKLKQTYYTTSIYEYYLDSTGNRQVVFDNRGSLYNNSEISNK